MEAAQLIGPFVCEITNQQGIKDRDHKECTTLDQARTRANELTVQHSRRNIIGSEDLKVMIRCLGGNKE